MSDGVSIRTAAPADIPAIRAIADLEHGAPDPEKGGFPEAIDAYHRYLIEHGDVRVAEDADAVVAFGAVIESQRSVHLADLFVLPDRQGRGIGRQLLEGLFGDRWPRTTFSSDDPRALPLYVRMGMPPLWPNLYIAGDARRLPAAGAAFSVAAAAVEEVAALELGWTRLDRLAQHRYWAGQPHAVPLVVSDRGRPVAAGHARALLRGGGRWMNTFLVAPGVDPHEPTLAAMGWSGDEEGRIGACVPGPHPIVPTLIGAGFRVVDRDTFQASDPGLVDPERVLPNTGFL